MFRFVKGGNPTFADGKLNLNGGQEFTRVQAVTGRLKLKREMTGTQPHALSLTITRDAMQGTPADLLAYQTMFGKKGRAQKSVFPLYALIIDDVRNGEAALIGTFKCTKTIITRILAANGTQTITFHASEWVYHNAISGQDEPADPDVAPVLAIEADHAIDVAKG